MMREGSPFAKTRPSRVAVRVRMGAAIGAVALAHGSAFAQAVATIDTTPDKSPEPTRVLTLEAAERAAVEAQPQLRVARAQTAVAEATVGQFRSPLLPQVTGVAQYGHEWGSFRPLGSSGGTGTTTGAGGGPLSNSIDAYSLGLSA